MNQKKNILPNINPITLKLRPFSAKAFLASTCCFLTMTCFVFSHPAAYANQTQSHSPNRSKRLTASSEGASNTNDVRTWFNIYDQIRRQAQLSPAERQRADQIMGRGLSIFMGGPDKALAQTLLVDLVNRYDLASQQMSHLQLIPATEQLHRGYYQYFLDAKRLFQDYLKVQGDLLAVDETTGQPVASGLVERKENLALLDQNNKMIDEKLRGQFGIPPYEYQSPQN